MGSAGPSLKLYHTSFCGMAVVLQVVAGGPSSLKGQNKSQKGPTPCLLVIETKG